MTFLMISKFNAFQIIIKNKKKKKTKKKKKKKKTTTTTYFYIDTSRVYKDEYKNEDYSLIRMRKKCTRVNIPRCVFILRCANQPVSKFKLCSHGFYHLEYFCM